MGPAVVCEVAEITVAAGNEAAFEEAVAAAAPLFRGAQGCRSLSLQRVVEKPTTYRLIVGWDSVEDHTVHFRNSPGFQEWRRLAGPYFSAPPTVDHTRVVLDAF